MTPVVNFEKNVAPAVTTESEIGELKGLLSSARAQGMNVAIVKIPVRLFAIDESYQTPLRTNRDLSYLVSNFDDNKLLPVTGVPHDEEGKIYLVDGYGRWKASQMVDKKNHTNKYESLSCLVILNAPTETEERRMFEAEQYAFQNKNVSRMSALQKHGAYKCMKYPAAFIIEELQKEYKFTFVSEKGNRAPGVLGSYSELFDICKAYGKECGEYIFNICEKAGFHLKVNGYSNYVLRSLRDIWKFYPDHRKDSSDFLAKWLREREPVKVKANAVARYGMLDTRTACSVYLEDLIVDNVGLNHVRSVEGKSITMVA